MKLEDFFEVDKDGNFKLNREACVEALQAIQATRTGDEEKKHSVKVWVETNSNGVKNQELALEEYTVDSIELVLKHALISDTVVNSMQACLLMMGFTYVAGEMEGGGSSNDNDNGRRDVR